MLEKTLSVIEDYEQIIIEETFDTKVYEHDDCRVSDGDVVVDAGAHIGAFSVYADLLGASRVLAYEPSQANYDRLVKNKPNKCKAYRAAIGARTGEVNLYEFGPSYLHTAMPCVKYDRIVTVPCISMADIIDSHVMGDIDFLKMDIEGFEDKVFDSMSDEYLLRIKKIALEWHHYFNPSCSRIINRISRWYKVTRMDDAETGHVGYVYCVRK